MRPEPFQFDGLKRDLCEATPLSIKEDCISGLQVALITLPQSMAYAVVAGLPPSSGIMAALFSSLIALFFSSSRYLIVGPVNTLAVLIQASQADILQNHFPMLQESEREFFALYITVQLSLLIGLFQLVAALFRFGKLTRFISHSVTVGYLLGSLVALVSGQLFSFFGLPYPEEAKSLFEKGVVFIRSFAHLHPATTLVGAMTLLFLLLFRKMNAKVQWIPWALLSFSSVIFVLAIVERIFPGTGIENIALVASTEEVASLMPTFAFPWFDMALLNSMVPLAFACALLATLETTTIAETVEARSGEKVNLNQEIFSVGCGNLVSSCLQAIPVSVSASRTFFNLAVKAKGRISALANVFFVAIFATLFARAIELIPLCSLAALMILTSVSMIRTEPLFVCFKATRYDRWVMLTTFFSCLFLSLDLAFYIGVFLSVTTYLSNASEPKIHEFQVTDKGQIEPLSQMEAMMNRKIRIVKVEGELFFASAKALGEGLRSIVEIDSSTKVVILQIKNGRDIDATGCLSLLETYKSLEKRGCSLLIAGVTLSLWEVMSFGGVVNEIGKENFFLFDEKRPLHCLQSALKKAQALSVV